MLPLVTSFYKKTNLQYRKLFNKTYMPNFFLTSHILRKSNTQNIHMNVSNLLLATKNKKRLYKSKKNTLKSFQMQSTSYKPKVQPTKYGYSRVHYGTEPNYTFTS